MRIRAKMFVDELGVYLSERMMKLFEQMNGRMNFKTHVAAGNGEAS